jgi:hypothetical protein
MYFYVYISACIVFPFLETNAHSHVHGGAYAYIGTYVYIGYATTQWEALCMYVYIYIHIHSDNILHTCSFHSQVTPKLLYSLIEIKIA